jgi:NodT family efflux transporter outer membrane factor (OMF) lipoprotein
MRYQFTSRLPVFRLTLLLTAMSLTGCAVGPDFKQPEAPRLTHLTETGKNHSANEQRLIEGKEVSAKWWTAFQSPALNELVELALQHNPDLESAEAALRIAQENTAAQRAAFFPSADLHMMPTRQSIAPSLASPAASGNDLYTLHTAQLNISYVPDVFGANRRQVESLKAQEQALIFQKEATYLTLTSNVVNTVIQEASLRAQILATKNIIASALRQLDLIRRQKTAGQATIADITAQEAALAQAQANLPPLEKQLSQQRHLLSVLTGAIPGERKLSEFELSSLQLPAELPVSLPSQLVEQRPDIRAAAAQMQAANAQIGVAIAARLPNISLSASIGNSALEISELLSGKNFWNIGGDIAQPLFNAGALEHKQKAAEAAYRQTAAQYRSTVLTAFQNVMDTLQAIHYDTNAYQAAQAAQQSADKNWQIARRQWEAGSTNILPVLGAEQNYQQANIALIQAQSNRYADTVALFQSLGGGWWNRKLEKN